jgi:hypothetical protein
VLLEYTLYKFLLLEIYHREQIDSIYSSIRLKMQYHIDEYNALCLQQEDDEGESNNQNCME